MKTKNSNPTMARFLLILFIYQILLPYFAPTVKASGPKQPDFSGFTPAEASDLVDLFSGDFKYNIPLFDLEGFPVNLSYTSNPTMDQEASCVGLGWKINIGSINRNVRGLPDDFSGEKITTKTNLRRNWTAGLNVSGDAELFGSELIRAGIGVGLRYNSYDGFAMEKSVNMSLKSAKGAKFPYNANLGINSSSDEGLNVQPSGSFGTKFKLKSNSDIKPTEGSLSAGASFNSRMGLKSISFGLTMENKGGYLPIDGSSNINVMQPTYTPYQIFPMKNLSIVGSFRTGSESMGLHPAITLKGYYSSQTLARQEVSPSTYGYFHLEQGQNDEFAQLDYNRENDGNFTEGVPFLPLTNLTYDIYSVNAQGLSGSYRGVRNDVGYVFDPKVVCESTSGSASAELGGGKDFHLGVDVSIVTVESEMGGWQDNNDAFSKLKFKSDKPNSVFEKFTMKEANEKIKDIEPEFLALTGGYNLVHLKLNRLSKYNTRLSNQLSNSVLLTGNNSREKRLPRAQVMTLVPNKFNESCTSCPTSISENQITKIHIDKTDGTRYTFGQALFSLEKKEVTFAVGSKDDGVTPPEPSINPLTNESSMTYFRPLVDYEVNVDNSINNKKGQDHYFNSVSTPEYVESYLLTEVLSPDYVDLGTPGLDNEDIGNWTKIEYLPVSENNWRVPMDENMANFNPGLVSLISDDKANYIFGTKQTTYPSKITTRNFEAQFTYAASRRDGHDVLNENGGISQTSIEKQLDKIEIFAISRSNGIVERKILKTVYFYYNYELCGNYPLNSSGLGKLTLKKIVIKNGETGNSVQSQYRFHYGTALINNAFSDIPEYNPDYSMKNTDRWGNYQPPLTNNITGVVPAFDWTTVDFPYTYQGKIQNTTKYLADNSANAWQLTRIETPEGGIIDVTYEADRYYHIQDKIAGVMGRIRTITKDKPIVTNQLNNWTLTGDLLSANSQDKYYIVIELPDADNYENTTPREIVRGIEHFYFKVFGQIKDQEYYEYVPGYFDTTAVLPDFIMDGTKKCIGLEVAPIDLDDKPNSLLVSPFTKAIINFGKMNMSKVVYDNTGAPGDDDGFGKEMLSAMQNSSFFYSISQMVLGVNTFLFTKSTGNKIDLTKSFVRINAPKNGKFGGGSRVKRIDFSSNWDGMTANESGTSYSQYYYYDFGSNGTSSGVASYEPQLGGEENSMKKPVKYNIKYPMAPDIEKYVETPVGECFFPSPSVGYARVEIRNSPRDDNSSLGKGKGYTVHEFYTSKDFPTIAIYGAPELKHDPPKKFSIGAVLKAKVKDHMTVSQGYYIEQNDMHGKQKRTLTFNEYKNTAVSKVEYFYKFHNDGIQTVKSNLGTFINEKGEVDPEGEVGIFYDAVADFRQSKTSTKAYNTRVNVETFSVGILVVIVPMVLPVISREETIFRSSVFTKVVSRFGLLERVETTKDGGLSSARQIAYDEITGDPLVTSQTNQFDQEVFSMNYPAYWHYKNMGPSYPNIGSKGEVTVASNGTIPLGINDGIVPGDEILLKSVASGSTQILKAWAVIPSLSATTLLDNLGNPIPPDTYSYFIIRSGNRNQLNVSMASINSMGNPLNSLASNNYSKVINANAKVFSNKWKTFCDCPELDPNKNSNPYTNGTKTCWKINREYAFLTHRVRSDIGPERTTNIKEDGFFSTYSPFYKLSGGSWKKNPQNWTFSTEVTQFDPMGNQVENKDAIGIYSGSQIGYDRSLVTIQASNARHNEIGFDGFEDYGVTDCGNNHFRLSNDPGSQIISNNFHTGQHSLMVSGSSPVRLIANTSNCNPDNCALNLLQSGSNSSVYLFSGGVAPFNVEANLIGGAISMELLEDGTGISLSGTGTLSVTVSDSQLCTKSLEIQQ